MPTRKIVRRNEATGKRSLISNVKTISCLRDKVSLEKNLKRVRVSDGMGGQGQYRRDRIITRAGGEIYSMAPFTNLFGSIRSCVVAIDTLY